jgi:hypothetical protein
VNNTTKPFTAGDRCAFWTGRGSYGNGRIRAIKGDRAFIDPDPDAHKGSDYRILQPSGRVVWGPRDHGVRFHQLNTEPRIWYRDN